MHEWFPRVFTHRALSGRLLLLSFYILLNLLTLFSEIFETLFNFYKSANDSSEIPCDNFVPGNINVTVDKNQDALENIPPNVVNNVSVDSYCNDVQNLDNVMNSNKSGCSHSNVLNKDFRTIPKYY